MNRRELLASFFAAPVVASVQSSWFALPKVLSTAIVGTVETAVDFIHKSEIAFYPLPTATELALLNAQLKQKRAVYDGKIITALVEAINVDDIRKILGV